MVRWVKALWWLIANLPQAVDIVRTVRKDIGNVYTRINAVRR